MRLTSQKKLLLGYVAVAGLIVGISAAVKACTLHTASFGSAESFIRMNPVLTTKLGPIDATYLKSSKFEMCRQGGSCARFEIVAIGHAARGIVRVNLQKVDSEWSVTSASVILPNGDLTILK
jgi:hypothetical protein